MYTRIKDIQQGETVYTRTEVFIHTYTIKLQLNSADPNDVWSLMVWPLAYWHIHTLCVFTIRFEREQIIIWQRPHVLFCAPPPFLDLGSAPVLAMAIYDATCLHFAYIEYHGDFPPVKCPCLYAELLHFVLFHVI